ncbi:unnamed protein product, partial [Discosporangium mesarthrocarpum]
VHHAPSRKARPRPRPLRRRRGATMRTVNGWVSEADPGTSASQSLIDRQARKLTTFRGGDAPGDKSTIVGGGEDSGDSNPSSYKP